MLVEEWVGVTGLGDRPDPAPTAPRGLEVRPLHRSPQLDVEVGDQAAVTAQDPVGPDTQSGEQRSAEAAQDRDVLVEALERAVVALVQDGVIRPLLDRDDVVDLAADPYQRIRADVEARHDRVDERDHRQTRRLGDRRVVGERDLGPAIAAEAEDLRWEDQQRVGAGGVHLAGDARRLGRPVGVDTGDDRDLPSGLFECDLEDEALFVGGECRDLRSVAVRRDPADAVDIQKRTQVTPQVRLVDLEVGVERQQMRRNDAPKR